MKTLRNPPQKNLTTLESIEIALQQVDTKKQALKKAFENLQSHSSLSLPSLSWSHIDSHFSSLFSNLNEKFNLLQNSLQPDPCALPDPNPDSDPNPAGNVPGKTQDRSDPVETRLKSVVLGDPSTSCERVDGNCERVDDELARICKEMDGKRLREYVSECGRMGGELVEAMRVAEDPGLLVLEAMDGFYRSNLSSKVDKDSELFKLRKSCLELLEAVVEIRPSLSGEVRERAKLLALEWKGKVKGDSTCEPLALLNLVVGYGLESEFDAAEFMEYLYAVARFRQAPALCKAINFGEKTVELIQRLIDNGKRLLAVKFIYECGMTEKFPPVLLLRTHLRECKKICNRVCNDGKSTAKQQIEALSREINAMRSVLQIIDEHKLESEYPKNDIEKRLEILEKQKMDKKNFSLSSDNKPQPQQPLVRPKKQKQRAQQPQQQQQKRQKQKAQQQQQQQPKRQRQNPQQQQQLNGNNRARVSVSSIPMAVSSVPVQVPTSFIGSSSTMHPFQQSSQQPTAPYGLVGSMPAVASYAGPSAAHYAGPSAAPYAGPSAAPYAGPSAAPYAGQSVAPYAGSSAAPYAGQSVAPYGLAGPAMGFYGNANPVPVAHSYAQESYAPSGVYDGSVGYSGYGLPQQYHPAYYPQ